MADDDRSSFQNELSFSDSSTYGTIVDGTLVKDRAEVVRDGAHIFVGDVELVVSFPQQSLCLDISSSDSLSASRRVRLLFKLFSSVSAMDFRV